MKPHHCCCYHDRDRIHPCCIIINNILRLYCIQSQKLLIPRPLPHQLKTDGTGRGNISVTIMRNWIHGYKSCVTEQYIYYHCSERLCLIEMIHINTIVITYLKLKLDVNNFFLFLNIDYWIHFFCLPLFHDLFLFTCWKIFCLSTFSPPFVLCLPNHVRHCVSCRVVPSVIIRRRRRISCVLLFLLLTFIYVHFAFSVKPTHVLSPWQSLFWPQ